MPLSFTTEELKREPGGGWSEPTIFVVDPGSSLDLIDLWNIRLFHPQIIPISLPWLKEAGGYIAD